MTVEIVPADPGAAEVRALLERLDGELAPLYPPEQRFAYPVEKLRARGVRFFVARRVDTALGCAGLEPCDGFGELKRMYVRQEARRTGVADALLRRIEQEARALGLKALRLETGTFQTAALGFYARSGFRNIPAYGDYVGSPTSVCMEKRL